MEFQIPMWDQLRHVEITADMNYAPRCPCVNTACSRNGFCDMCKRFHEQMDHGPTCTRREPLKPMGTATGD